MKKLAIPVTLLIFAGFAFTAFTDTSISPIIPPYPGNSAVFLNGAAQWSTPAGGGGGTAGTVIASGTPAVGDFPKFTDTSGTNIAKASGISESGGTLSITNGQNAITIGTGVTSFTLSSDPVRYTNSPVALFRPATANTPMIADLMGNGLTNMPTTWDLVNRDLRTVSDTNNWNVARLSVAADGIVTVGSASWGTNTTKTVEIVGGAYNFTTFSSGTTQSGNPLTIVPTLIYAKVPLRFYNDNTDYLGAVDAKPKGAVVGVDGLTAYGTRTDGSNYRRANFVQATDGTLAISSEGLGTGATGNKITMSQNGTLVMQSDGTRTRFQGVPFDVAQTFTATTVESGFWVKAPTGFISQATDAAVNISATGWTNSFGKAATAWVDGSSATYVLYNNAGTAVRTNTAVAGTTVPIPLQSGGKFIVTAGSVSGSAVPW